MVLVTVRQPYFCLFLGKSKPPVFLCFQVAGGLLYGVLDAEDAGKEAFIG